MAIFVLAPRLKEIKERCKAVVGIGLEMAVDQDVTPIANFFGEIHRIEYPAQRKPGDRPLATEGREINLDAFRHQGPVQKTRMAGLIAGHQLKQSAQVRSTRLKQPPRQLLEEQKTGKL